MVLFHFCCAAVVQKKVAEIKQRLKTGLSACVVCRTGVVSCCPVGPSRPLGSPQGEQRRIVTKPYKPLLNIKDIFLPDFRLRSSQMLGM